MDPETAQSRIEMGFQPPENDANGASTQVSTRCGSVLCGCHGWSTLYPLQEHLKMSLLPHLNQSSPACALPLCVLALPRELSVVCHCRINISFHSNSLQTQNITTCANLTNNSRPVFTTFFQFFQVFWMFCMCLISIKDQLKTRKRHEIFIKKRNFLVFVTRGKMVGGPYKHCRK